MLAAINLQKSVDSIHRQTEPGAEHIGLPRFGFGFVINRLLSKYKTANERLLRACHLLSLCDVMWKENQNNACPMPRAIPPTPTYTLTDITSYRQLHFPIESIRCRNRIEWACAEGMWYNAHWIVMQIDLQIDDIHTKSYLFSHHLWVSSLLRSDLDFGQGVSHGSLHTLGQLTGQKQALLSRAAT